MWSGGLEENGFAHEVVEVQPISCYRWVRSALHLLVALE